MNRKRTWKERKAIIALGLVDVWRGVFTAAQAAQIEAWRAENEAALTAMAGRDGRNE